MANYSLRNDSAMAQLPRNRHTIVVQSLPDRFLVAIKLTRNRNSIAM
jgi:hypothetical protein